MINPIITHHRYSPHYLVDDFLACGWMSLPTLHGTHHGQYAVHVVWLCNCPLPDPLGFHKRLDIISSPEKQMHVGERFAKLDGMNFPGVVKARFVDQLGRACYIVKLDDIDDLATIGLNQ